MVLKVVDGGELPTAKLNDIPSMLRHMAKEMEAQIAEGRVPPRTLLYVAIFPGDALQIGCFGDNPDALRMIGTLHHAGHVLSEQMNDGSLSKDAS